MGNGLTKSSAECERTILFSTSSSSYIPRYRSNSELLPHRIINNITKREDQLSACRSTSVTDDNLLMNDTDELDSTCQNIGDDDYNTSDVCYLNLEVDNRLFRINSENYSELYLKSIQ